jgi:hypothetical protein
MTGFSRTATEPWAWKLYVPYMGQFKYLDYEPPPLPL